MSPTKTSCGIWPTGLCLPSAVLKPAPSSHTSYISYRSKRHRDILTLTETNRRQGDSQELCYPAAPGTNQEPNQGRVNFKGGTVNGGGHSGPYPPSLGEVPAVVTIS